MSRSPLLRSRLVAALAKRTLLASSSAFRRSSTVRSGARLSISALVYHRRLRPVTRSDTPPPPSRRPPPVRSAPRLSISALVSQRRLRPVTRSYTRTPPPNQPPERPPR